MRTSMMLLFLAATQAHAAFIDYTAALRFTETPVTLVPWIQGFDPSLGTLLDVTLTATADFHFTAVYQNDTDIPFDVDDVLRMGFNVRGTSRDIIRQAFSSFAQLYTMTFETLRPGESVTFNVTGSGETIPFQAPGNEVNLSSWATASLVPVDFFAQVNVAHGLGLDHKGLADLDAWIDGGTVTVRYEYEPAIPEPSTWAFLALGLLGLSYRYRMSFRKEVACGSASPSR
jgi:hypothetical protein